MNQEVQKATKLELDAYVYLQKKLQGLANQIEKAVTKKSQQDEAREMELMEYKTEEDIQDAYGWDIITDEEREKLLARLQGAHEKAALPTKEKIALDELRSIIKEVRPVRGTEKIKQNTSGRGGITTCRYHSAPAWSSNYVRPWIEQLQSRVNHSPVS